FNGPPLFLTGTVILLVINMTYRKIGVSLESGISKLHQIDVSMEEASADLGAGPIRTFRKVVLPLLSPAFVAGFVYAFMTSIVSVSAFIFLISPGTNLAAKYILNVASQASVGRASAMSVILIVVVLICMSILKWIENRYDTKIKYMNSIYKEEVFVADHDSTLISLQTISKTFGEVKAVNDISIDVKRGELITFIGPSGCGKSTLLRTIAGFNQPTSGDIYLEGNRITDLVPEKRETGMVFQSYALFPHMTVFDNVAYGLNVRKLKKDEIKERVHEALEQVE